MSNTAALQLGRRRAKEIIAQHILDVILVPFAKEAMQRAIHDRIFQRHNMTGNTINSYATGVYNNGHLVWMGTPSGEIPSPLRNKLRLGQKFRAGNMRWDGDLQQNTFKATVDTNGAIEPDRSISFLNSYKPQSSGWEVVVCNGVEYASYQETSMGIDVLTKSHNDSKFMFPTFIKPISD